MPSLTCKTYTAVRSLVSLVKYLRQQVYRLEITLITTELILNRGYEAIL